MPSAQRHHLFYPKSLWRGGPRRELREHPTSIVIINGASHDNLHRGLHNLEGSFRPPLAVVLGMLAVANELDGPDSLDNVVERIQAQIGVAKDLRDKVTPRMLSRQIRWIESGYIGGKGPAPKPRRRN